MITWVVRAYVVYLIGRLVEPGTAMATATMISAGTHITAKRSIGRTLDLADLPSP